MIPTNNDNTLRETVRVTPRLATSSDYRITLDITSSDNAAFDTLEPGESSSITVTDTNTGTKWQMRPAPCTLTENGSGCYCDAIALPIEYPGGLDTIPVELEAPLEDQLRAVRAILKSPQLHPANRLQIEEAEKQLEHTMKRHQLVIEVRAQLDQNSERLTDRKLPPSVRAYLNLEAKQLTEQLIELTFDELLAEELDGLDN